MNPAAVAGPERVQVSLGAAMALGYRPGSFRRGAVPGCLNLLLAYPAGCAGRCAYCGLSPRQPERPAKRTFIRVDWPSYPVTQIVGSLAVGSHSFRRACVSMVTHPQAFSDTVALAHRISADTDLPVTALVAPTSIRDLELLHELREAGVDRVGVGLDAATPELFDRWRGASRGGPHRWQHYREVLRAAVGVLGRYRVGAHLIAGLGESERQMVAMMQELDDEGVLTHLFSFYPEPGTVLEDWPRPGYGQYRRLQLARFVINEHLGRYEAMAFDDAGRLVGFGVDTADCIRHGEPFRTSGCPGQDGQVACNRPFANERPARPLRNFPMPLEPEDIALARYQLIDYGEDD